MKKTFRLFALMAVVAATALGFTSCNSDDGDDYPASLVSFVTYEGSQTGSAVFSLQNGVESPEYSLTAQVALNDTIKPGTRVVIAYNAPGDTIPGRSTNITLLQLAMAQNGNASIVPSDSLRDWRANLTNMQSMWRTGPYINMTIYTQGNYAKQHFDLLVDESTLSNEVPDLYLVNAQAPDMGYPLMAYYASLNVGNILYRPGVTGIRIHVNGNGTIGREEYVFMKDSSSMLPTSL